MTSDRGCLHGVSISRHAFDFVPNGYTGIYSGSLRPPADMTDLISAVSQSKVICNVVMLHTSSDSVAWP